MFRQKQEINNLLQQILDAAILLLAFWGAHTLRSAWTEWFNLEIKIPPFSTHLWMVLIIVPFGPLFLGMQGFYQHPLQKNPARSLSQILRALIWLGLLVGVCVLSLRLELPSRGVLVLFVAAGTLFLLAKDYILRLRASHLAAHGQLSEPVLLAGLPVDMERLVASFSTAQKLQINVVDRIDISEQPISALVDALHRHSVTRVIFAAGHGQLDRVQAAIEACETEGVEAWMMADFIRTAIARPTFDMLGERPMLVFRTTSDASWELLAKRVLDILGAIVGLILLSPFLLAIAIVIKLGSPGPVLFRQQRGGLHGRPFTMLKFRSMVVDAEERKTALVQLNKMEGPVFKVDGDPRVTRFGQWLRKTSLDESAAALQCPARRDEPGRPAPAAARRDRAHRDSRATPAPERAAGPDLPVANQRAQRDHQLRRVGAARSGVHRQLVALARHQDPLPHRAGGAHRLGRPLRGCGPGNSPGFDWHPRAGAPRSAAHA